MNIYKSILQYDSYKEVEIISYKKMFIAVILAVFCLFIIIFFYVRWSVVPQIDDPIVKCSTLETPTVKTDFVYRDSLKRRYNFHTNVSDELLTIRSVLVQPNEELKVIFKQKPSNYCIVRKLYNGNYEKVFDSAESSNGTFTAPSKPGKYEFSISANYKDGLGIYYFSIEVSEK